MEVEVLFMVLLTARAFGEKRRTVCSLGLFIPKLAPMK